MAASETKSTTTRAATLTILRYRILKQYRIKVQLLGGGDGEEAEVEPTDAESVLSPTNSADGAKSPYHKAKTTLSQIPEAPKNPHQSTKHGIF